MKPIRLVLTAIGPYKEKEVIDFTKLNGQHLFVISGATGAGKTTIFDGICFALYGTASGADRANTGMLRSHFADDQVHTSVDFQFAIKGRTYRVFRQLAHTKAGNKTKTGEKNELYEKTGDGEVPIVDRQIVSEVNVKIEELIGLTEGQFKQIVMLPQGEFRKLLTSETENKEAILRRLFQTEKYQAMHELLKEKIEDKSMESTKVKQRLEYYRDTIRSSLDYREDALIFQVLHQEHHNTGQVIAGLKAEKSYLDAKIDEANQQYKQQEQAYDKQQEIYHQSIALNERFTLFNQKKEALDQLNKQKEQFAVYEEKIKAASLAAQLLPYETNMKEREKELADLLARTEQSKVHVKAAEEELKQVNEEHRQLEKQAENRENRKAKMKRYTEFLPVVQEMNRMKETLQKESTRLEAMEQQLKQKTNESTKLWERIAALKQTVGQQETEIEPLHDQQMKMEELRQQYRIVKKYMELAQETDKQKSAWQLAEQQWKEAEQVYRKKETAWLDNQAIVLAGHLTDGEACPVCGSAHHPDIAKAKGEDVSKEQLELFKLEVEKQRKHFDELDIAMRTIVAQQQEQAELLRDNHVHTAVTTEALEQIAKEGTVLRQQTDHLKKVKEQLPLYKKQLIELESAYEKGRRENQTLEQTFYRDQSEYARQSGTFTERMDNIPEELRDLQELQTVINKLEKRIQQDEKEWQLIQQQLKEKEAAHTTAAVTLDNEHRQLELVQTGKEKARTVFIDKLQASGFSTTEEYVQAKMSTKDLETLQDQLDTYQKQKLTLEKQVIELEAELKGKTKQNTDALKETLAAMKEKYDQVLTSLRHAQAQHELVVKLIGQMEETEQASAALEKEVAAMTDVYDMIRGQNSKKISFERYLQIDYLDQIIQAANGRFRQLMNGQFYLLRSDRQETHGKQSGLAIDVYDSYTGQTRDVKTLSGGEKFIASLCLALGMSDVIQSEQGSISIETMFIDEGFGSLDEESLHKSIDALIQIQKTGRMIGVISHVEELKTIFPALLQVKKTKEGHSRTKFILK